MGRSSAALPGFPDHFIHNPQLGKTVRLRIHSQPDRLFGHRPGSINSAPLRSPGSSYAGRISLDQPASRLPLRHHRTGTAGRQSVGVYDDYGLLHRPVHPDLLNGLYERGNSSLPHPGLRFHVPFLRLAVPVHVLHAGAGFSQQPASDLYFLGTGRTLLLPAHRFLVLQNQRGPRFKKGLHRYPLRRFGSFNGHSSAGYIPQTLPMRSVPTLPT